MLLKILIMWFRVHEEGAGQLIRTIAWWEMTTNWRWWKQLAWQRISFTNYEKYRFGIQNVYRINLLCRIQKRLTNTEDRKYLFLILFISFRIDLSALVQLLRNTYTDQLNGVLDFCFYDDKTQECEEMLREQEPLLLIFF